MPAKSGPQRRAAGMALAIKRGETPMKMAKGAVKQMAKGMNEQQLSEYARKPGKKKG